MLLLWRLALDDLFSTFNLILTAKDRYNRCGNINERVLAMSGWFMGFILTWSVILIVLMGIGGFFMFRKFLKSLPKNDGRSILDWQTDYIKQTRHLWTDNQLSFLEELVSPVPQLFRDVAKEKIAGKIGQLALKQRAKKITEALIIEGYIKATPKRDHKFLRKTLVHHDIDVQPYEHFFN